MEILTSLNKFIPNQGSLLRFSKTAALITLTQLALDKMRSASENINQLTGFSAKTIINIRRTLDTLSTAMIIAYFFKHSNETLLHFIKKHPAWISINILIILSNSTFFTNLTAQIPQRKYTASEYNFYKYFLYPCLYMCRKLEADTTYYIARLYNNSVIPAVVEELFFKGASEIFLKQFPYFALRLISTRSSQLVDSSICQAALIGIRSIVFAFGHIEQSKNWGTALQLSLTGMNFAYLSENMGLSAAILTHFATDLYLALPNQRQASIPCDAMLKRAGRKRW